MPHSDLDALAAALDDRARADALNGVVSIDVDGAPVFAQAYGLADRAHVVPNTVDTRFGMASASKAFTALAAMALVEDGALQLDTPVRSIRAHHCCVCGSSAIDGAKAPRLVAAPHSACSTCSHRSRTSAFIAQG